MGYILCTVYSCLHIDRSYDYHVIIHEHVTDIMEFPELSYTLSSEAEWHHSNATAVSLSHIPLFIYKIPWCTYDVHKKLYSRHTPADTFDIVYPVVETVFWLIWRVGVSDTPWPLSDL